MAGRFVYAGMANDPTGLGVALFALLALPLLLASLAYSSGEFAVTTQRVIIKTGVIHRRSFEMILTKVEGVSVDQGLGGRIFGYGTLSIIGTGGTVEVFPTIADPMEFRRHALAQVQASQASAVAPPVALPIMRSPTTTLAPGSAHLTARLDAATARATRA